MGSPDLGRLQVDKIIVHDVPRHFAGQEGPGPVLSEVESPADQDLRNYFREKIIGTLGSKAVDVVFDPEAQSPIPKLVAGQLDGRAGRFVEMSQDVARYLHEVQTGANSPGLVIVVRGRVAGQSAVGLLKLEREEAIRLEQLDVSGKSTFRLQHLRDLMLNRNTRVFKAGLFWQENGATVGRVCDEQGRYETRDVAYFFLRRFLGCALREEPEVTTKNFLQAAEGYINEQVVDPERKARYTLSLIAEMTSQSPTIDPRAFARRHLELADRDPFVNTLREGGVDGVFPKDTARVDAKLRRVRMDFEKGIALIAPPDVVAEDVRVETREGDVTHVEFEDRLKGIHGKS
jgi:hypothetical protein